MKGKKKKCEIYLFCPLADTFFFFCIIFFFALLLFLFFMRLSTPPGKEKKILLECWTFQIWLLCKWAFFWKCSAGRGELKIKKTKQSEGRTEKKKRNVKPYLFCPLADIFLFFAFYFSWGFFYSTRKRKKFFAQVFNLSVLKGLNKLLSFFCPPGSLD